MQQRSMETGDLVVNMALVISAPDLHKKLTAKEMPSLSWFKLQFYPKDATIHSALNYTGQFSVKNMIQERTTRKAHDGVHYARAIYKYDRVYAVSIRDLASFVCTDDKHKISVEEPVFSSCRFTLWASGAC